MKIKQENTFVNDRFHFWPQPSNLRGFMSKFFSLYRKEEISQRSLDRAIMNRWLYQRWCFILFCSNEDIKHWRVFYEFSSLVTVGARDFRFPSDRHWSILPLARNRKPSSTQGAFWLASDTYVFSLVTQSSPKERGRSPKKVCTGGYFLVRRWKINFPESFFFSKEWNRELTLKPHWVLA